MTKVNLISFSHYTSSTTQRSTKSTQEIIPNIWSEISFSHYTSSTTQRSTKSTQALIPNTRTEHPEPEPQRCTPNNAHIIGPTYAITTQLVTYVHKMCYNDHTGHTYPSSTSSSSVSTGPCVHTPMARVYTLPIVHNESTVPSIWDSTQPLAHNSRPATWDHTWLHQKFNSIVSHFTINHSTSQQH